MTKTQWSGVVACFGFAVCMGMMSCAVKDPVRTVHYPEILEFKAPYTVYLNSEQPQSARVTVSVADIRQVTLRIETPAGEAVAFLDMTDNGLGEDLIANDGQYVADLCGAAFNDRPGFYNLIAVAAGATGFEASDRLDSVQVTADVHNLPPTLGTPRVPAIIPSNRLNTFHVSISADDPQGLHDISEVRFQIYAPLTTSPCFEGILRDGERAGDSLSGDGLFSILADLSDTLNAIGEHTIRFQAVDRGGLFSAPRVARFQIVGVNTPPVLSGLLAPEQVSRQAQTPFVVTVHVWDEQGLSDIRMVYFNSVKPDGVDAAANPIMLFDDGLPEHGDATAGDGEYSRSLMITPANMLGVYTFTFYAEDHGGNVSEPIVHRLRVVDGGNN